MPTGILSKINKVSVDFGQIVDGMIISDASILYKYYNSKKTRHAHFRQGCKHITFIKNMIDPFTNEGFSIGPKCPYIGKDSRTGEPNYTLICGAAPYLTQQRERWYVRNIKMVPNDLILNPLTLKYWYYGDGGLNYCKQLLQHLSLATHSFKLSNIKFLCNQLQNILQSPGIYPTRWKDKYTITINKSTIPIFLEYIGPCEHPCFQYKWIIDNRELYNYYKNNCPCTQLEVGVDSLYQTALEI